MIRVDTLAVGPFQSNCHIVSCDETGQAALFDPGDEDERILEAINKLGAKVTAIVCTHAHLDHVSALPEVAAALKVPVLMHRAELPIYEMVDAQATMFGLSAPGRAAIDRYMEDGEILEVGNLRARILLSPGHSPGSVCALFDGASPAHIVVGDVLFQGSIGRTDLPGGDYDIIIDTLRTRFLPLADDTIVHPGHGPDTTIGWEKRANPFLAPLARG
jgi:glyoxylase-like metal-dependent hydrolase (beta-lactamase superfamily II)